MKTIKLSDLKLNDGSHGLPKNPRFIRDERFKKLCDSIRDFPEAMPARGIVIDENSVILGGNMRYRACLANGMKEIPTSWVHSLTGLTVEQKRRFIIMDNRAFGDDDMDMLANEWDMDELLDAGFDEKDLLGVFDQHQDDDEKRELDVISLPFGLRYSPTIVRRKGVGVIACSLYGGDQEIIDSIKNWKTTGSNGDETTENIADALVRTAIEIGLSCSCIATPQRHHEGFHAGTSIAMAVAKKLAVPFMDLFGFNKEGAGHHPIKNALREKPVPVKNICGPVVIVDDVATSGETMRAAVQSTRDIKQQATGIVLVHYWNEHE
jgi:hypothetical protein